MDIINKLQKEVDEYWGNIIIGLVILAMAALFAGGWEFYYYKFPDNFWFCMGMTLQNCMETLLFNPVLTIQDIVEEKDFINSLHGYKYAFVVAYKIAMVTVPFLEVLAAFCFLDRFLHIFAGFTRKEQRLMIVGYNDRVRKLLKRGGSNAKIYLWVDELLSEEEERDLYFENIMIKKRDFSIGGGPNHDKEIRDGFNKFLKNNKISNVLLLDESDFRNMEYYMLLSSCPICKEKTIHFFVLNKDFEMRNMLQDYFDRELHKITKSKEKSNYKDTYMDLRIFNFQQIQAEILFQKLPLFFNKKSSENNVNLGNNRSNTIHLLILGEGDICEQILYHSMNQGVITSDNEILIDVISEDTMILERKLQDRFNENYVKHKNYGEFQITSPESDGNLVIRLSSCNFDDSSFIEQVKKNSIIEKYNYIVFCLPQPEKNFHCMLQMKKSKEDWADSNNMSVAVMITDTEENKELLESFNLCSSEQCSPEQCPHHKHCQLKKAIPEQCSFERLYLMGENEEKIGIAQIINSKEENEIREYHANYEKAARTFDKPDNKKEQSASYSETVRSNYNSDNLSPDELWNREEYYKRESNRALYFHQKVKQDYIKALKQKGTYSHEVEDFRRGAMNAEEISNRLLEIKNGQNKYPGLLEFAKTEHRRFNYFYASMGWGKIDGEKNPEKRLHDCLCEWKELTQKRKRVLSYDLISFPGLFDKKH